MNTRHALVPLACVLLLALLLVSCPMPQLSLVPGAGAGEGTLPTADQPLSVQTDAARGQAVFVNEKGVSFDIAAVEPDGTVIACVEALGISVAEADNETPAAEPAGSKGLPGSPSRALKAIVVGMRADGSPGIWIVLRDDTIVAAADALSGAGTACLPESEDRGGWLRGRFGWRYYVTGISEDGRMVVGYAKHEKGYRVGRFQVEPGTTIGVYWKIERRGWHPFVFVYRARVIGVLDHTLPPRHWGRKPWHWGPRWPILAKLKLFFLDYYSAYLVMTRGVSWDAATQLYSIPGTDQDGNDALATIDRRDRITITVIEEPTEKPDLAVTAVQVPGTAQSTTSTWTLGATVENLGQADAGASTLEYRMSRDATLDAGDTLIGTSQVPALPVGSAPHVDTYSTSFSIAQPGRYWIFATARLVTPVEELDTANNSRSATVSIIYGTLIVDTYIPNPLMSFSPHTGIELFGPAGTAAPIAGVSAGSADYARLTYTGPLEPGTYYIRITGLSYGAYAVRTLTALPVPEYSDADYFDVVANPDPYEANDTLVGGVPVPPLQTALGDRTNRFLDSPADQDWIQVVLP